MTLAGSGVDMEAGGAAAGPGGAAADDEARCGGRFVEEWCCACAGLLAGPNPMMARYLYALIFLVTNLLAWTLRDYGNSALDELQRA